MVGSCMSDCLTTGLLDIGTITFSVLAPGVNTFSAYVIKVVDDVRMVAAGPMFAGIEVLMVSPGRRLSTVDSEVRVPSLL